MRQFLYLIIMAFLAVACHTGDKGRTDASVTDPLKDIRVEHGNGPAVITFDNVYFDLGALDINGPDQMREFSFANTGGEPLVVERVEASCPCLDIVFPKEPIAPGRKAKITMTLKMQEVSSGQFYRSAMVYTNASEEPTEIILQGIKKYE